MEYPRNPPFSEIKKQINEATERSAFVNFEALLGRGKPDLKEYLQALDWPLFAAVERQKLVMAGKALPKRPYLNDAMAAALALYKTGQIVKP